nr:MAG TPA: hypothetical protein [Caudoviricetes sp.]
MGNHLTDFICKFICILRRTSNPLWWTFRWCFMSGLVFSFSGFCHLIFLAVEYLN